MKKSSKQRNKQNQKKAQQNKPRLRQPAPSQPDEQTIAAADGIEVSMPGAEVVAEPQLTPEIEVAPQVSLVSKSALIAKRQAGLLAQQQKAKQAKQWNQQVKAGKMVGAHVPKRFNRGG